MSIKGYSKAEFQAKYPNPDDFYHSKEWKAVRQLVLKRDQFQCQLKTKRCIGVATFVHHINSVPFNPETCLDPDNLIAICKECHKKWNETHKHDRFAKRKLHCRYCGKMVYWNKAYFDQGRPQGVAPTINSDGTEHHCSERDIKQFHILRLRG